MPLRLKVLEVQVLEAESLPILTLDLSQQGQILAWDKKKRTTNRHYQTRIIRSSTARSFRARGCRIPPPHTHTHTHTARARYKKDRVNSAALVA